MESGIVTTPFGRRPMTFGMLSSQMTARKIEPDKSVDKWKLHRALCEAKPLLGVTDRALAVLNALLSCYPQKELAKEHGLIVFPSNAELSLRTHGMAEQTIRRHLAALINAGLLIRKDSPNGKRYARKHKSGQIDEAFGFSLAPLLARAEEIERLAAEVIAERLHMHRLRERLTLCRRDLAKLVEAALNEGIPGDWMTISDHFRSILSAIPRTPTAGQLRAALNEMENLRERVTNQLETQLKVPKQGGNPYQSERHLQSSQPESVFEPEPRAEAKQDARSVIPIEQQAETRGRNAQQEGAAAIPAEIVKAGGSERELKFFPLDLVLRACHEISAYGPRGSIGNWRDFMTAAVTVRTMLEVSASAYDEACHVMGPVNAATVMACILERGGQINSAGGYLRDLTRRAEKGEFALGPMLMALLRSRQLTLERVS